MLSLSMPHLVRSEVVRSLSKSVHKSVSVSVSKRAISTSSRFSRTLSTASANKIVHARTPVSTVNRSFSDQASRTVHSRPSAPQCPTPPYKTVIVYNQSKHASQSVLADIRAVWGNKVRVIQVLERGGQALPGMDATMFINLKTWGDVTHFGHRLDALCTLDSKLSEQRQNGQVAFMPGWSAFAESSEAAVQVSALSLVWPGTEPVASQKLEKIGFKQICDEVGAPTPPFVVLSEEGRSADLGDAKQRELVVQRYVDVLLAMGTDAKGLIKSIHGGGGKGTAHLNNPSDPGECREAVEKVLNEMSRSDGIYYEQKVNSKGDGRFFQLELEVDGDEVTHGGRFVWFNSRLQKVVEIGLSDDLIGRFMPKDLYSKAREWSRDIARKAGNNTRATMEALVFEETPGKHELMFIECNRRPQVENEALALLQQDSSGNRRYTFAELLMRAAGHPVPYFEASRTVKVALHARILHGNPDLDGNIAYQPGNVIGMTGPRLDWVVSEALAPGEISFTADPQLGKAVITADSWEEMCDRGVDYFKLRKPFIKGPASTYAQTMQNLFSSKGFREGSVASNETFANLHIPAYPERTIQAVLQEQLTPLLINGYRPGEGIDPERWPTQSVCNNLSAITAGLRQVLPLETVFTKYTQGRATLDDYYNDLRGKLEEQGGGWVTVAPRDTAQQGNDSESAGINALSRRNAECWGVLSGCVGYETGGAQFQAGLIRGFDPSTILTLGLPFNMPAHSLQRSQYVNGLAELPSSTRTPLFQSTAQLVRDHYRGTTTTECDGNVPWFPYNFHAGNYYNEDTGYSPQDETTGELLAAGCSPLPNWVFSGKFSIELLAKWTDRQITLFESHGRTLQQVRIKNPGQGADWTTESVWAHIQTIREVFKKRGLVEPMIFVHNHDFNGLGGHIARELLLKAQQDGFPFLIFDAAYRKNGTHNDNTIVTSALNLTPEKKEALIEFNHLQQSIEEVLVRFNSRNSQMTPWNSDWAGGTEGSDLRIAKEYILDPREINHAKEVASEVFPLERAVTPFSEYKLRLGIAIMIEPEIHPKTPEAVRHFIAGGGKLKVGGDVLVGLHRWETLLDRPETVNKLLTNMKDELKTALEQQTQVIGAEDIPGHYNNAERYNALAFQQKGLDFIKTAGEGKDLTAFLIAPHILHRKPRSIPNNTRMTLLINGEREKVDFMGFGKCPNGDLTATYRHAGVETTTTHPDPDAVIAAGAVAGNRKADPAKPTEYGTVVPGELLRYFVKVGDKLTAGEPLCVLESMKMEVKISVHSRLDGHIVKSLPCKERTAELQGELLKPGDLLLETEEA